MCYFTVSNDIILFWTINRVCYNVKIATITTSKIVMKFRINSVYLYTNYIPNRFIMRENYMFSTYITSVGNFMKCLWISFH